MAPGGGGGEFWELFSRGFFPGAFGRGGGGETPGKKKPGSFEMFGGAGGTVGARGRGKMPGGGGQRGKKAGRAGKLDGGGGGTKKKAGHLGGEPPK